MGFICDDVVCRDVDVVGWNEYLDGIRVNQQKSRIVHLNQNLINLLSLQKQEEGREKVYMENLLKDGQRIIRKLCIKDR